MPSSGPHRTCPACGSLVPSHRLEAAYAQRAGSQAPQQAPQAPPPKPRPMAWKRDEQGTFSVGFAQDSEEDPQKHPGR